MRCACWPLSTAVEIRGYPAVWPASGVDLVPGGVRSSWAWFPSRCTTIRMTTKSATAGLDLFRTYQCGRCKEVVFVCRTCDRGNRYCSEECRGAARAASLRNAARRYQRTESGRQKNAERQRRWRQRQMEKRLKPSATSVDSLADPITHQQRQDAVPGRRRPRRSRPWPAPPFSLARRPQLVSRPYRNDRFACDFCGEHRCHFASRREVWPGPSRWRATPPNTRGS